VVDADLAAWAVRQLGDGGPAEPGPTARSSSTWRVTNWPAFRSFVLTFLHHAEILGRPSCASRWSDWLVQVGP